MRRASASSAVLKEAFTGADAVVHLAWALQPGRDESALAATNVDGSNRVFVATQHGALKLGDEQSERRGRKLPEKLPQPIKGQGA